MIFKLSLFVIAVCFVCVECRPQVDAKILRFDNDVRPDGYDFGFETSNGIRRQETGAFQQTSQETGILSVSGESSYPLDNAIPFTIKFVADERGYRPSFVIGQGQKGAGSILTQLID